MHLLNKQWLDAKQIQSHYEYQSIMTTDDIIIIGGSVLKKIMPLSFAFPTMGGDIDLMACLISKMEFMGKWGNAIKQFMLWNGN